MDVLPTAGAMQLKRIAGAYSSAIVLEAIYPDLRRKKSVKDQCESIRVPLKATLTHTDSRFGRIVEGKSWSRPSTARTAENLL